MASAAQGVADVERQTLFEMIGDSIPEEPELSEEKKSSGLLHPVTR